jgi:hypothetical protein
LIAGVNAAALEGLERRKPRPTEAADYHASSRGGIDPDGLRHEAFGYRARIHRFDVAARAAPGQGRHGRIKLN